MQDSGENWCILEDGPRPGDDTRLLLKRRWESSLFDVIKHFNVQRLQISDWDQRDLGFLSGLGDRIKSLTLSAEGIEDISAVNGLTRLERLCIGGELGQVDFTRFSKLRELWVTNERLISNYLDCTWLTKLNIGNLRIPDLRLLSKLVQLENLNCGNRALKSLDGLEALKKLTHLSIGEMSWESMAGLDKVPQLTQLYIGLMPKLVDIGNVGCLSNLRRLSIRHCNRVRDLSSLANLKQLQMLDLCDCKSVASIRPIKELRKLKGFNFAGQCKIKDGDISFLLELPRLEFVAFKAWKHYTHTAEQIRQAIRDRGGKLAEYARDIELDL